MPANDAIADDSQSGRPAVEPDTTPYYEIRVAGRLGAKWTAWFDGLEITDQADGTSLIRGAVADQAALHGLLDKVRDIGLRLESLTQVAPDREPTNDNPSGASS